MRTIIDVHCHLGQFLSSTMSADGARLCDLLRRAGIGHGVAFSIEACYGSIDLGNRYTLDEAARHEMLSAMVVAHPHHLESSRRWVREAASSGRIVGVKLHPVLGNYSISGDASRRLVEEVVAPSGLPVLVHTGADSPNSSIDRLLRLAGWFPEVSFIAAHLGVGVLGAGDEAVNAWFEQPLANVWFDMATLRAFHSGAVDALLAAVGPDRLLFGTDSPLYSAPAFAGVLETLEVSEEIREKVAFRNALAVIPRLRTAVSVP